ncbi:hypothetical protein FB567DRAFT_441107 [Paraphoma chrysanthemicola]|uniref:CFEM domain-containing protein n=1 Tax=Paraphoma chrysanthemicola TaxID=798071 RepID=A0A8K0VZY7_9PLEO|nr:hypothetical protein FB567DRAFT_441107 [Paraphoma chrysanthemicola]
MKPTYAFLAGLAAQQAAATWNLSGKPFKSPQYANNECSDKQKNGFDWSDLKNGDSNFQYGDFDFSAGWKCATSVGKRDLLSKRTFGNKAIVNKCSKEKPASFGCNKKKDGFSITTIDVSVEFDTEVDLHYTMTDGSLCKQKSVPCKKEGSTIENTQCGGAKSVDVYLGSKHKGEKTECEIGFHHIGFDCSPPKEYNPPSPPQGPPSSAPVVSKPASTPPPAESTAPPQSTPLASSTPASTPASCNGGSGEGCPPVQTPPAQSTPAETPYPSSPPFSNSSLPLPPTYETTEVPLPSYESSTVTPVLSSSTVVPSPPSQESSTTPCNGAYGESCGASSTPPSPPASSNGASVPPPPPSSAKTPVPETSSAPPSQSSYPPSSYPPPTVGEVLPTCMNTWLQISTEDCKDNTAADCYCKNAKFTKNVIDCVQAWCETDEETKSTLQYLVGICAQYVPENPSLVEDCPNDTFNPPTTPTGGAGSTGVPVNTPAASITPTPSKPVTTIVYGSTSLTVPQVHFTTETPVAGATPTAPVGLVPGVAPPQTPATTTVAPYPIPSTLKPSFQPTGTGAIRPSSPAQFTGAASPSRVEAKHVVLAAALAFFAL